MTKEMYEYLHEILAERAHPNNGRDHSERIAYMSCMQMLEYAEAGNVVKLAEFETEDILLEVELKRTKL